MIGIFIGSFNPPTLAHLNIAINLNTKLKKVVFVPVNSKEKTLIELEERIKMLKLLAKKYSFLEVEEIMKKYSYMNYKVIDILKKKYKKISLIIGSDLLEKLDTYDNYHYLLTNYTYTIIPRNNCNIDEIINEKYLKYKDKFQIINYNNTISSSMVRELIKENKDYSKLLDEDIYLYIKNNKLYI